MPIVADKSAVGAINRPLLDPAINEAVDLCGYSFVKSLWTIVLL